MMKLKPESLATPAVFTVAVPAGAELKKELKIGATIAMRQDLGPVRDATPKPVPVNEVFPVTVTTVPALEVTALAADDQAKPAHVVPHVICRVEATDLKVAIEPPEGVELAANEIALGAAKVGSIRNPQFPLVRYAPDREYTFKITASAAGRTTTAELKLKLAGDGKPGADEFLAWEKSLRKRDFTDFAQGMGNWQDSGTGAKFTLEREEFIGNTSRREFIHFAKPAEIADFTFEFDTYMEGHGNRANGAPVAMVSREQRTKLYTYTAFRAIQVNTFSKDGFIMNESWQPVGEKIPYKGDAKKEIAGEQWVHMKIAGKGNELIMFINDWPVCRVKEQPLAERWLSIQNGYDNFMYVDNILVKYASR